MRRFEPMGGVTVYDLQRASSFKRFSAFLFDFIILSILAVGFGFALSAITGYDARLDEYQAHIERYEAEYGVDLEITAEEYEALGEDEKKYFDEVEKKFGSDGQVLLTLNMVFNLTLLVITLGVFLAFLVLEFAVPLAFGNGQTLGKKIFGVGIMFNNGVKINSLGLFVRSILGKYTVETMIPILIVLMIIFFGAGMLGAVALVLIPVMEAILFFATRNRSLVHDVLSGTVTVDMSSQMIFDTYNDMLAYKTRVHAEAVEKSKY